MNLTIDNALHGIAELLRDRISPEIGDPFAAQMARLSCMLLTICANGVDDAAEIRVDENSAIRALLRNAAALVDPALSARLTEAAAADDPSLKLGALDDENHRLRGLLVEAQAVIERLAGANALAMDQRIWRLLEDIGINRAPREKAI
jgi:hypothetical protein